MSQLAVVYISMLKHAFDIYIYIFFHNFSFFDLFCRIQLLFEFEQCYGYCKKSLKFHITTNNSFRFMTSLKQSFFCGLFARTVSQLHKFEWPIKALVQLD